MRSVYLWTKEQEGRDASRRRGGRRQGLGVHVCTGPVLVHGAEPGDVLEVRIIDVTLRAERQSEVQGLAFGGNAAANWGFHYNDFLTEPTAREVITIYELDATRRAQLGARDLQFPLAPRSPTRSASSIRPSTIRGCRSTTALIDAQLRRPEGRAYPGAAAFRRRWGWRPRKPTTVNSMPPGYTGGNIDNWRIGKGATIYYPVAVPGALLSVGDPHASQGDFGALRHGDRMLADRHLPGHPAQDRLSLPARRSRSLDVPDARDPATNGCVQGFSYPNYLAELGADGAVRHLLRSPRSICAMRDAFRKMRRFLMTTKGLTEDEAISLMSIAVDFGITQVVDGNWRRPRHRPERTSFRPESSGPRETRALISWAILEEGAPHGGRA